MKEMDMLRKENFDLKDSNAILKHRYALLEQENEKLLQELKGCHEDICDQIAMMTAVKKELRRYEVQLNSLKSENAAYKARFEKIENNFIGRFALKIYRKLREFKRRLSK